MSVKADNLTIWMNRGEGRYIVQEGDTFYLADLYRKEAVRAYPPTSAELFLKAGLFEDTDELTPSKLQEIQDAFKNKQESPVKAERERHEQHERHGNNGREPRL